MELTWSELKAAAVNLSLAHSKLPVAHTEMVLAQCCLQVGAPKNPSGALQNGRGAH